MSGVLRPDKIPTGNGVTAPMARFSFLVPNLEWVIQALNGMLADYSQPGTWQQDGTATPDDAADIFTKIWNTFGVDLATTGVIVPFAGGILPDGWLICDGSTYAIEEYPNLFAAIGNVWGGDGISTFKVPDLRGRTLLGQGTAVSGTTYGLGETGGDEQVTLSIAEMPSHSHTDTGHSHTLGDTVTTPVVAPGEDPVLTPVPIIPGYTGTSSANLTDTGGDEAHPNMQPFAGVNYAIIS